MSERTDRLLRETIISQHPHSLIHRRYLEPHETVQFLRKNFFSRSEHRCEASTMELAPRNKELYENRCKNEFSLIKTSPFDAEFDSASIGASFNDGKTFGQNPERSLSSI